MQFHLNKLWNLPTGLFTINIPAPEILSLCVTYHQVWHKSDSKMSAEGERSVSGIGVEVGLNDSIMCECFPNYMLTEVIFKSLTL